MIKAILSSCNELVLILLIIAFFSSVLPQGTILYPQENLLDSSSPCLPQQSTIGVLCPSCTTITQYGVSLWVYKTSWANGWNSLFRVSNDTSQDKSGGRAMLSVPSSESTQGSWLFWATASANSDGTWNGFLNSASGETNVLVLNQWVFVSLFVDATITTSTPNNQFGIRYYLGPGNTVFQQRNGGGAPYQLNASAVVYWGGKDPYYLDCLCKIQYFRIYVGSIANTQAQLISLAWMGTSAEGQLFLFYFASDSTVNNNQTFIVDSMTNMSASGTIGFKGYSTSSSSAQDPSFGPYNSLMCRPGQIASFPLNTSIPQGGIIVGLDFYPYPGGASNQTIFSIRDTSTNYVSLRFDYIMGSNSLNLWINPVGGSSYYVLNASTMSSMTIGNGNWNRIILEIVQPQPQQLAGGDFSVMMWINKTASPYVFIPSFITDPNSAAIDICGVFDSSSAAKVSSNFPGYFDVLNFVWFQQSGGLYLSPLTAAHCLLQGAFLTIQSICLQCASGYYLQDSMNCVTSASNNSYFLHSPTNSYQRCFYGQYYNISNGVCSPCNADGQLIKSPQCVSCDPSCRKCTGTSSNQCTACYLGYYLNTTDFRCYHCTPPCAACSFSAPSNCTTCNNGLYLSNSTCVATCPLGEFANTQTETCDPCGTECQTCTKTTNFTQCSACSSGYFLYFNSCVLNCSSFGYYLNTTDSKCYQCSSPCAICSGPGPSSCTDCGNSLYLDNSTCVTTCPQGKSANNSTRKCEWCQTGCQTCSDTIGTECSACRPGYFLYSNNTGTYCLQICPSGYKPDYTTDECVTSLFNISQAQYSTLIAAPLMTSIAFTVSSLISGEFSTNLFLCLVATESLANMQYLNLNHSNIASTIYAGLSSSYIPNWIANNYNNLDPTPLIFDWGIFKTNQISALYLNNFGDSLTEMMLYVGIYLLSILSILYPKKEILERSIGGKVYITAFSFLISNILGQTQSQMLFSMLQIIKSNIFVDLYSRLSVFTAYITMSLLIGILIFGFLRLQNILRARKNYQSERMNADRNSEQGHRHQIRWMEKKYQFMFGDFKRKDKNCFFFIYWINAFNMIYILLIFSLQSVPGLQCFSIFVLALAFILFSAFIKPFKEKGAAFVFFFNLACILFAAFLNLILANIEFLHPDFSGSERQGWAVVSVIIFNTATNTLFSLGTMILEIYKKIKAAKAGKKTKETIDLKVGSPNTKLEPIQLPKSENSSQLQDESDLASRSHVMPSDTAVGTNLLNSSTSHQNILDQNPTSSPLRIVKKIRTLKPQIKLGTAINS